MKKILLLLIILSVGLTELNAQVVSITPNSCVRSHSLTTTIRVANGIFSTATPPYYYQDIYLQQGSAIIYTDPNYSPYYNVYGWPFPADSLHTSFTIPANAPLGLYDVHVISYDITGMNPVPNVLTNGFMVKDYAGTAEGDIFFDRNQNGIRDTNDYPLANQLVYATPGIYRAYTNASGHYKLYLDSGNYVINYQPTWGYVQTTAPSNYSITVPPSDTGLIFGAYQPPPPPPPPAPPFYVWNHPMKCYPFYGYSRIDVFNNTQYVQQGSITLVHSSNLPIFSISPPPDVTQGDTLTWYYSNLAPSLHYTIGGTGLGGGYITFVDPPAGDTVWYSVVDSLNDSLGAPLTQYFNSYQFVVTCACDPNEKEIYPAGDDAQHFTPMDADLYYTLNFQNTGNDTAVNVIVFDTLDPHLDRATFEVLASSDPVQVQISPAGVVRFAFDNILLPDSNVDEPGSLGWVGFRIRPDSLLPDPTVIRNSASIVFDANEAVQTNTRTNTLTRTLPPVASFSAAATTLCANTCVNFTNSSRHGTSYHWYFPGGLPASSTSASPQSICYFNAGNYDVTLVTTNLRGSDSVTVHNYLTIQPSPAPPTFNQIGDTLFAPQGYTSYQWYYDSTAISGATNYFYVATQNGNYNLLVSDNNGCQSGAGISNVMVSVSELSVSPEEVRIYPNPAHGKFSVIFRATRSADLRIVLNDALGRRLMEKEYNATTGDNKFETGDLTLSPGVYDLKIDDGKNIISKKVLIK